MMQLALIQHHCTHDSAENLDRTCRLIQQAAQQGAELVMLQELHSTLYFCQSEDQDYFQWAEPIPGGRTLEQLSRLAKTYNIVLVGSLFEKRMAGLYHNTAVVLEKDGSLAGKYRKMHIPDDPGFYEKYYFTPGDLGFKPIHTSVGALGLMVCWDQWFPEAARLMALAGADILLYPTAIGWNGNDKKEEQQRQLYAWQTVQQGHAIANHLPVAACNRVGYEPHPTLENEGIHFWGNSFICGPQGEVLSQGSEHQDEILMAQIDYQQTYRLRHEWPYLRDRRVDAYSSLTVLAPPHRHPAT